MKNNFKKQTGQAMITLIFFTVIASTIIAAAVSVLFSNILSTSTAEAGLVAYYVAESGAEEGLLQLLRNPEYAESVSPTEIFEVGDGSATTQLNSNGSFTVTSWKEIE